jgi:WD40 repeat protein
LKVIESIAPVGILAMSPVKQMAITGNRYDLSLWELPSGTKVRDFDVRASISAAVYSPDGRFVAYGTSDGAMGLREIANDQWRDEQRFQGHRGRVTSLAFVEDGTRLLSGGEDRTIRVWDVASGEQLEQRDASAPVPCVAAAGAGSSVLFAQGNSLRLWRRGEVEGPPWDGHKADVLCMAISTDGKRAASADETGSIHVWDTQSGKQIARLAGHSGRINALALTRRGMTAMSGGNDGTVRLWDIGAGKEIMTLTGHTLPVRSVAMSHEGLIAASGSDDKTIRVWRMPFIVQ